MIDLQSLLSELSANAKGRNVKFIKDLTLNGVNMGKIGSFVIFIDENPFSVRESCKAPWVYKIDLNKDLKQWHYINTSIDGYFEGNEIQVRHICQFRYFYSRVHTWIYNNFTNRCITAQRIKTTQRRPNHIRYLLSIDYVIYCL